MRLFCILIGIILLNGCTTLGDGNVKPPNLSESKRHTPHYSAHKVVSQESEDRVHDNLSQLPEYILIRI